MARDEFLKPFKPSKPLAGSRFASKIPVHTPKPVREIDIESKLSDYKPYEKASK